MLQVVAWWDVMPTSCAQISGPYVWQKKFQPDGMGSYDLTVFQVHGGMLTQWCVVINAFISPRGNASVWSKQLLHVMSRACWACLCRCATCCGKLR